MGLVFPWKMPISAGTYNIINEDGSVTVTADWGDYTSYFNGPRSNDSDNDGVVNFRLSAENYLYQDSVGPVDFAVFAAPPGYQTQTFLNSLSYEDGVFTSSTYSDQEVQEALIFTGQVNTPVSPPDTSGSTHSVSG